MKPRPLLTIAKIVEQFDVSRATVRRGIENGRFPGASKDSNGRWVVPIEVILADGLKPRKTWLDDGSHERAHQGNHERDQGAQQVANPLQKLVATELAHSENERAHDASRIAQLEAQLEAEQRLRKAAELNADDLRTALRMIEAAPTQIQIPAPQRRWWQRAQR